MRIMAETTTIQITTDTRDQLREIDFETKEVYVFEILTAEQAHKNYDRLV